MAEKENSFISREKNVRDQIIEAPLELESL